MAAPDPRPARRHRGSPTLPLGVRGAVATATCRWAGRLPGRRRGRPCSSSSGVDAGTEAWLLFFALFPQLWAMLPDPLGRGRRHRRSSSWRSRLVRWAQTGFSSEAPPRHPAQRRHLDGACPCSLGLFIHRIIGEAESRAADDRRAARAPRPSWPRPSATAACTRSASASRREIHDTLAQGFTSVVALSRAAQAALARGDVAAARERLALIEAHGLRQPRRGPADRRRAHARAPAVAHPRRGPRAARRRGSQRDRPARRRAGGRRAGAARRVGRGRHPAHRPGGAVERAPARVGAARVDLTLAYDDPDEVVLTVRDDGLGFDLGGARSGSGSTACRPARPRSAGRCRCSASRAPAPRCAWWCRGDPAARRRRPPGGAGRHGRGARRGERLRGGRGGRQRRARRSGWCRGCVPTSC